MSKLSLIIQREYITRVRKKSFIILSLLAPIGMILLMFIPALIEIFSTPTESRIAVIDNTNVYGKALKDDESTKFVSMPKDADEESVKQTFENEGYHAYMVINGAPDTKDNVKVYSKSTLTMDLVSKIERDFREGLRRQYLENYNGHSAEIDSLFNKVNSAKADITTINISKDDKESESSAAIGMIVSGISMFLIYMFVLMSGSMVMASVVEEKSSRIVEVLVSSVKPFDLMMGKVLGIALTILTQFAIWFIVGIGLMVCSSAFMPTTEVADMATQMNTMAEAGIDVQEVKESAMSEILRMLSSVNFVQVGILFVLYFIGGYMLYASLFACVGSAIENQSEGQQLMMPITITIIIALYIAIYAAKDPNSSVAFWGSIIPFTSPVVMMARLPFSVPTWEIILSLVVLFVTFVAAIWVAARIYRVGILMYGKKVTFKELIKWFKQSE